MSAGSPHCVQGETWRDWASSIRQCWAKTQVIFGRISKSLAQTGSRMEDIVDNCKNTVAGTKRISCFLDQKPAEYNAQSMLGLLSIYNRLPAAIVERCGCVSSFQGALQDILVQRANAGELDWHRTFSPKVPWHSHPLTRHG